MSTKHTVKIYGEASMDLEFDPFTEDFEILYKKCLTNLENRRYEENIEDIFNLRFSIEEN